MNPRPVVPPKYLKSRIGFKVIGRLAHIRLFEKLINSNKYLQQTTLLVPHPQMGYRKRSRNRYGNFMFYQTRYVITTAFILPIYLYPQN